MAGVDSTGYLLKTENDYFAEEISLYQGIDAEWNLDPSTPDGIKAASDAEIYANLDESLQQAYNSKDPNKARDVDLDIIASLTGTVRGKGTPSTAIVTLTGVENTVIAAGALVKSSEDESEWALNAEVTIPALGTFDEGVTCTVNGATTASIGAISEIVEAQSGWQGVSNAAVAEVGTNPDSNGELRLERNRSVSRPGNNQVDSMTGEILATDGVRRVVVYENETQSAAVSPENPHGLPASSISAIVDVDAPNYDAVALSMYVKKNPGVLQNHAATNQVSIEVQSPKFPNQTKIMKFSTPNDVNAIVAATVENDGSLPDDVDDEITQAIIDYANADLDPSDDGFNDTGFDIGVDVAFSRLYTPINYVLGKYGNSFVSALTLNGTTNDLVTPFNSLSRWIEGNITITVNTP